MGEEVGGTVKQTHSCHINAISGTPTDIGRKGTKTEKESTKRTNLGRRKTKEKWMRRSRRCEREVANVRVVGGEVCEDLQKQ